MRQPFWAKSMSTTRPVTVTGPRWRCSIGAWRSRAVSHISAKPAAKTVSASAASHHAGCRRSAKLRPAPAIAPVTPGHSGGSTFSSEIDPDPGAEKHRQPQQAALALGGEAIAKAREKARSRRRREADPFACDRRIRHYRPIRSEHESMVKNS